MLMLFQACSPPSSLQPVALLVVAVVFEGQQETFVNVKMQQ